MIRVFIADDHEIVRTGLTRLFQEAPDMVSCGAAASGHQLFEVAKSKRCDVLVIDVNMDGCHGPRTVREILALSDPPAVVVFTMHPEDSHAIGYLRAGAQAYITKRRSSEELLEAIRHASQGRRYITPTLAEHLFEHQIDLRKAPHELLSPRELEVVRGLSDGLRATELAALMDVRVSTVNTYVHRIKTKLGVRTVVEVVAVVRNGGLLG